MTGDPAFLRRLTDVREHSVGWCTPCPDRHSSSGYAVVISLDERAGRYRFTCAEAVNGDVCGNERDLIRMLGVTDADVRLGTGLRAVLASDVEMRSIEWFEKPLWQQRAFELLAGPKGAGKGTYLAGFAARVSQTANVVFIATEDSAAIDLVPRLTAAGASLKRVYIIKQHIKLPDDIAALEQFAHDIGGVGLLVIDPVANHIGDSNSNSDAEVRHAIAPLNKLADDLACLIIGVRHPGKDRSRGAVASILGSTAWVDTPRAAVMIAVDDEDPLVRHIHVVAGNRSLNGSGHTFRIEAIDVAGLTEPITRAVMLGDSTKSVDQLLAAPRVASDSRVPAARVQEVVLEALATGEKSRTYLDQVCADELGVKPDTVYKSGLEPLRKDGAIVSRKSGWDGGWHWRLKSDESGAGT